MIAICTHCLTHNVPRIKSMQPWNNAKQVSWMCQECRDANIRRLDYEHANAAIVVDTRIKLTPRRKQDR